MGVLAASLKARLAASQGPPVWIVDIGLPTGTVKYGVQAFHSATEGFYASRVTSFGTIPYQNSDRESSVAAVETSFELTDLDRAFARVSEGPYRDSIEGSTVTIRMAHPDEPVANWRVAFTGVIRKWTWSSPMAVTIVARADDLSLRRKVPRSTWTLTQADWPNIAPDDIGKLAPLVYGTQDSQGYAATGMVRCSYVNNNSTHEAGLYQFVVAAGIVTVGRVYVDGAPVTFAQFNEIRGGKQWSTVILAADPLNGQVTADVVGYDCATPGGGSVTTNPATMLAHLISNFVYGDYRQGPWLATSARVSAAHLSAAASLFTTRGYRGGRIVGEENAGYDEVQKWAKSFGMAVWWTAAGTLAIKIEDPTDPVYVTDVRARHDADFAFDFDDQANVTDLKVTYNRQAVDDQDMSTVRVNRPKVYSEAPDEMRLEWWSVE